MRRYCKFCNKHTIHKVVNISTGHKRGSMKRGGKSRTRKRGLWRGMGNLGKYSKPAVSKYKRKSKTTKKTNLLYTCQECKKSHYQKKGKRTSKIQVIEKTEKT